MSTTQGPSEPSMGTPLGAVPQPPPGGPPEPTEPDPSQSLRLSSRSGDTAVVFRLSRDVPFLHRLRELASDRLERLLENPRMAIAAVVSVLGVGALAVIIGDAYRPHPTPVSAPVPAAHPVVLPLPAQAAPPAQPAQVAAPPAEVEASPEPAPPPRPVPRPRKPRAKVAVARVQAPAPLAGKAQAAPPARPRLPAPPTRW